MKKSIEETIRVFGENRTAYTPMELKTLMQLRDDLWMKEAQKYQVVIASLIVLLTTALYFISALW